MNDIVDMSRFIEAKSDQLNADDLIGAPRTITVTRVTGNEGDQPVSIFYQGDNGKPFKPCLTIRRVLMGVWGRHTPDYVGRSMTLYRDDKVTFGGLQTGGIRISHMSHIDKEVLVVVMKSKGKKAGIKILPLAASLASAPAASATNAARQTPEDWLAAFIASVNAAETTEALATLHQRAGKAIDKLDREHPALAEAARAAVHDRAVAISAADDPFGLPPISNTTDRITDELVQAHERNDK